MEELEKTKKIEQKEEKENNPMTTENLERLLKEITPEVTVFSEESLDLPIEPIETPQTVQQPESAIQEVVSEPVQINKIPITNLESWFNENASNINNINKVIVSLRGVD